MDEPIRLLVTLIGFRGCGKTTVGRLLADRWNWKFVDSDTEIERKTGKSIAMIFKDQGEAKFRQLEKEEMETLLNKERTVISTGGGAILDDETREAVSRRSLCIWLTAKPDTIRQRLENDLATHSLRPALSGKNPIEEIDELLKQREPLYSACANITIDTDFQTPNQIVDQIHSQIPARFLEG